VPQINPSIPILLQPDATEEAKVQTALTQLVATINALDATNLVDSAVTPAKLEATLLSRYTAVPGGSSPWQFAGGNTAAKVWHHNIEGTGADQEATDGDTSGSPLLIAFDPAALAITGKTTKLRIRGVIMCNATASGIATMTFGLYTISSQAGGSAKLSVTVGAAVTGGTIGVTVPATSARASFASADFAVPAAGEYLLGWQPSAAGNLNAKLGGQLFLEAHYV
jgi:hypothetical protein